MIKASKGRNMKELQYSPNGLGGFLTTLDMLFIKCERPVT